VVTTPRAVRSTAPGWIGLLALAWLAGACASAAPDPARNLRFHLARACADRALFIGVRSDASSEPEFHFTSDRQASASHLASAQACYRQALETNRAQLASAQVSAPSPPAGVPAAGGSPAGQPAPAAQPSPSVPATGTGPPGAAAPSPAPRPPAPPAAPAPEPLVGDGPVIALASPADGLEVSTDRVQLVGAAASRSGVARVAITVNGRVIRDIGMRGPEGPEQTARPSPPALDFAERITLLEGRNQIVVIATDARGQETSRAVTVVRAAPRGTLWAVVIGISKYRGRIPSLKYADRDAQAFHEYLATHLGVPRDNLTLLLNEQATLNTLKRVLGTELRRKAAEKDTVVIFFAGHGAPEADATSADDDGLEKYLVPHDADPADLYTTALPMREIEAILQRLASERVVFIADACYSGAASGRTFATGGRRAFVSDTFLTRLARGRGRVVLTASRASEVSEERDLLRHGVFTFYLLEGLRGAADTDGDGFITVDEAYAYVSRTVPPATGQGQHPQKKGDVEGQLAIGRVLPPK
jgi:uncharacterized caspase-like protein